MIVLSQHTIIPILSAWHQGQTVAKASPDLGISVVELQLTPEGPRFPGEERLAWQDLAEIARQDHGCFLVENGSVTLIRRYSEAFDRYYNLYSTDSAPTMLISGIPMHRIKDTDPHRDTLSKIKAIAPLGGRVLDTTTGLGYTAIEAAKTAMQVITIELDPTALEIARLNPWSQPLFDNPKIEQLTGDSFEVIQGFSDESFSAIIHDPPMFNLAGELYSKAFYQQAYRVLKRNGKIFHYIGDPNSKSGGRTTSGVGRRLQEAGFRQLVHKPQAFGLVAFK